ncbi:MAG: 4-hydroxythreonine-4-phosphate dehydrogenase PdxA [candidate division WOR-3 bacterium]|nr:4-hydroxythreonine-4-phosphate dehydrogenase PdxA [candidate division WOR-3 bacterium]
MIGITIGDPSGIGPEIVLKAISTKSLPKDKLIIIGNRKLLENLPKKILHNAKNILPSLIECKVIDAFENFSYEFGKPQKKCGIASLLQLNLAIHLLKVGEIKGIVTAPVSKTALSLAGFLFPGQTEYFAREFGVDKHGMLAWSKELKIILVTIHHPLKDVPKLITKENVLEKIILLNNYLNHYEKIKSPKIGVFSLNPHAFEFTCGAEYSIVKAIKQAQKQGIKVYGPIPADSIFADRCKRTAINGYVAMYHDQGMLPVKLLSQGTGVNVTLGLPFIRSSPLHGVAFDIAGQGIANPRAMYNAITLCLNLTK